MSLLTELHAFKLNFIYADAPRHGYNGSGGGIPAGRGVIVIATGGVVTSWFVSMKILVLFVEGTFATALTR